MNKKNIPKYSNLKKIIQTNNISSPSLLLDLDALDSNIKWLLANSKKNIRIATKSIRSIEVIKYILKSSSRFKGLMCYSLAEALWLRSQGFKDLLVAYPCVDLNLISELKKNPNEITIIIDCEEHLKLLSPAKIYIAIDLDMSTQHFGIHFGVRRSPINNLEILKKLLAKIKKYPSLNLCAAMGYEAQIAGVTDKSKPVIQLLKKLSTPKYLNFRKEATALIKDSGFNLTCINGGGAGSVNISDNDDSLTEITAGSLFYAPTLFDHYKSLDLTPALTYSLQIIRNPQQNIYTCFAGGFIASGTIGIEKQPQIILPENANFLSHEGFGEVQTPFEYSGKTKLNIGDPIFLRHAKAGEVCERIDNIYLYRKQELVKKVSTYRGQGENFS